MSAQGASSANDLGSVPGLTANKIGAIFVFFATSFLGVWVPYFFPVRPTLLKFGLLFASGLFLGVAFLHLSVDCNELFDDKYSGAYPLASLVIVLGFYMTWFADIIAGSIWGKKASRKHTAGSESSGGLSCCKSDEELVSPGDVRCTLDDCPCTSPMTCSCSSSKVEPLGPSIAGAVGLAAEGAVVKEVGQGGGTGGVREQPAATALTLLDVVLLLVALCFHAIFEGLAVGLSTSVYSVWNLTLSICLNEFFEGLALGTTLRAQDVNRKALNFFFYALGASVVAPLGIVIGIVLDTTVPPDAASWAQGIGNGLAAGVFICIASRHLIAKAMRPEGPSEALWMPFLKFFVSGLGLATNALTTLRTE